MNNYEIDDCVKDLADQLLRREREVRSSNSQSSVYELQMINSSLKGITRMLAEIAKRLPEDGIRQ